jgi:tRNA-dihydrouridine synthase
MIIKQSHRRLSIAPMMEYTHHIGRQFLRIFNQEILIYGEMVAMF